MKVLFAVNNEKVSNSIIKKYQTDYKEIISVKNVYYFNAIIKELQKDKSYDRIVISEDLEPFSNKNYDMIDKFLFDKLDSISDEASNSTDGEIPIILICTDRREKGNQLLIKLFSLGIYSALLGEDRTIDKVCKLINQPRTKKAAKIYYRVDNEDVNYSKVKPEDVSETEVQNILNHYKKLGKNEEKYVESFNNIATQYTDTQLKIIAKYLPLNVKAVLEEKCPKYQEIMIGSVKGQIKAKKEEGITTKNIKPLNKYGIASGSINSINDALNKPKMTKPIVIPSSVDLSKVEKVFEDKDATVESTIKSIDGNSIDTIDGYEIENDLDKILGNNNNNEIEEDVAENEVVTPVKRGRGRPPKPKTEEDLIPKVKRGRGRPRKNAIEEIDEEESKQELPKVESLDLDDIQDVRDEDINDNILPGFEDEEENEDVLPGLEDLDNIEEIQDNEDEDVLPGLEDVEDDKLDIQDLDNFDNFEQNENQNDNVLPGLDELDFDEPTPIEENRIENNQNYNVNSIQTVTNNNMYEPSNNVVTGNGKIVSFVGTSKNGTSFLVNNLAELLSQKGINTAILDLTKNKNAFYIYNKNDEGLRQVANKSIQNLRSGITEGIKVNKNLTVYTMEPGNDENFEDYGSILQTLANNYSVVLLDCDFNTNYNYFNESKEIYIVQTFDILTIQPLTAFLRELSDKGILKQEKLRIIVNKALRVRNINEKNIIGGISSYNNPSMSYMKELFDKNNVPYITIPFEEQTYSRYLEGMAICDISLKGYSRGLLDSLNRLSDMVYPLISGSNNKTKKNKKSEYGSYDNKKTFNI